MTYAWGMGDSFAERWAAKERAVGQNAIASPMVACGTLVLPRYAGPFLSFKDAAAQRSVWDLFQLSPRRFGSHRERLSRYTAIGSDGAGNPICLRGDSGALVMLEHENLFEGETFVNTSVEQLAECLLAYMGEHDPERLRAAVLAIDAPAMADSAFWWFEVEDLRAIGEDEEADGDSPARPVACDRPEAGGGPRAPSNSAPGKWSAIARLLRRVLGRHGPEVPRTDQGTVPDNRPGPVPEYPSLRAALMQAGWVSGRSVDTAGFVSECAAGGYIIPAVILPFLAEFGGLVIRWSWRGPVAGGGTRVLEETITIDPIVAMRSVDPETVQAVYTRRAGTPLCPIGEVGNGHGMWLMDDRARSYVGCDAFLTRYDSDPLTTLEKFFLHDRSGQVQL